MTITIWWVTKLGHKYIYGSARLHQNLLFTISLVHGTNFKIPKLWNESQNSGTNFKSQNYGMNPKILTQNQLTLRLNLSNHLILNSLAPPILLTILVHLFL